MTTSSEQYAKIVDWHFAYRQPFMAAGAPGHSKTSVPAATSLRYGLVPALVRLSMSDGTDLKGLPQMLKDEVGRSYMQWVKEGIFAFNDKPISCGLDEYGQGMIQAQNAGGPLLLEKRVDHDTVLHPDSIVWATTNRLQDQAGVTKLPKQIPNRVTYIDDVEVSVDAWADIMVSGGSWTPKLGEYIPGKPLPEEPDTDVIQFFRSKGAFPTYDPNEMVNCTPRQAEWVAHAFPVLPEDIQFDVCAGRIGGGLATELRAFMKHKKDVPTREEIMLNPKGARVPKEISARYLVCGTLAGMANPETIESVVIYADKLPPEFQAMVCKDAMKRDPRITHTAAFVKWGVKFYQHLKGA